MTDAKKRPDFLDGLDRYKLLYPVTYKIGEEDNVLEHIQMRRLTLADRIVLDQSIVYAEKAARILSDMTGLPRVVMLKIDAADATRIDEIFNYYLPDATEVGEPTARPPFFDELNELELLYPIEWKEGEESCCAIGLKLRRLTLGDRLILDEPIVYSEKIARILVGMTGHPRAAILKIDAFDADRIDQIFGFFLQPGIPTGATS